ncbi:MAG: hypothetical protein OXD54_16585 [Candidatus Poribacteria bacterium]|nr:hypothetical protein [Candidatus Poribacteria bacterium]
MLAPTYEYGYVGFVCGFVFHSDSIIARVVEGWKGLWILEQYISNMFYVVFSFQFFQNQENKHASMKAGLVDAKIIHTPFYNHIDNTI